jgi:hypothetical protein
VLALASLALASDPPAPARPDPQLWFYCSTNLSDEDKVAEFSEIFRRAAAAGYRHVVLADNKFSRLGEMNDEYFEHVRELRRLADTLGIEIVPLCLPIGRSQSLLAPAPDYAEGLPVVNVPFEVQGGIARVVQDPRTTLGKRPDAADFLVNVSDNHVSMGRNLRRSRFRFKIPVAPWRCYRVSVEIKTNEYTGRPLIHALAGDHAVSQVRRIGVKRNQDWTRHQITFNSLDHRELTIWFGVWQRAKGSLEWRNWKIEALGPHDILRRDGAPVVLEGAVEGRDVSMLVDTLLGNSPWRGQFEAHDPPEIHSTLPDGARFTASWTHAAVVYGDIVTACLGEPRTLELLADEARRVREMFQARGYLVSYSEIRALGADSSCIRTGLTPGKLVARHVAQAIGLLPGAQIYVWNDIFDPLQNARPGYYLVAGDLAGSWEGLEPRVTVMNWNHGHMRESLEFFANRGHAQVIAGYYDGDPEEIRDLIGQAQGIRGVEGVMYATWENDYDDLEAFANAARDAWKAPPPRGGGCFKR